MSKFNVQEEVTKRVVEGLKAGKIPWRKPWENYGDGLQRNLISKKPYRGINQFLLSFSPYSSPYWLTIPQASKLGGKLKKINGADEKGTGQKSTMIVFWKMMKFDDANAPNGEKTVPLLRYFLVFNVEQFEGIDPAKIPTTNIPDDFDPVAEAEAIIDNIPNGPAIEHGGDRACYLQWPDEIHMPKKGQFVSPEAYYASLLHEEVHATGNKKRVGRDLSGSFGSDPYAKEELVAEMGAAMLCAIAGISTPEVEGNTQAYINGWISKLESDPKLLVQAGGQAQKAVDYILRTTFED